MQANRETVFLCIYKLKVTKRDVLEIFNWMHGAACQLCHFQRQCRFRWNPAGSDQQLRILDLLYWQVDSTLELAPEMDFESRSVPLR
jgi:predicted Fe-S protein YdhL (DUF1289 family)